jgi:23S rRNA (uridine2552-2'-O)-methyltransferase
MTKPTDRRQTGTRVYTARGRTISSTRWLQRQLNDPYVQAAKKDGYRSRAAYKLVQLQERFTFLKPGYHVVDLGAAPGGWMQVAAKIVGHKGKVIGIDLVEVESVPGCVCIQGDFLDEAVHAKLLELCKGGVDVVLSDMAAASCGHAPTDHIRIMALCEAAFQFAQIVLKPGGTMVAKILRGGAENEMLALVKKSFAMTKHVKPAASRSDSAEMYLVAMGYRPEA